ncbi:arsenate reductase ArsC [Aminivibrio sp.]
MNKKPKVLFLCTGNSCRSQMAEGWTRYFHNGAVKAYSAGIEAHGLNPFAVEAMKEAGVDISGQRSKNVTELLDVHFDYAVTLCGDADERCPFFPGETRVIHVGFDDPPKLALLEKTEEGKMNCYRRIRDEIRAFVEDLPGFLENLPEEKRS